jgi:hypothetical protein
MIWAGRKVVQLFVNTEVPVAGGLEYKMCISENVPGPVGF